MTGSLRELTRRAFHGDRLALARCISSVENQTGDATAILDASFARAGRARRLGVTGPPGAGKSTLVSRLARTYRARDLTVGVVAVDPTSPFSGGALLGDRVRMGDLAGDDGVFIRSMASRGSLGGLAVHTAQVCDVLDASGFDRILIETVGVGQSELEVAQTADSTAVVLVPESGDGVQAMKAGLMEIGDLFVINKADREGAERGALAVRMALEQRTARNDWEPPVLLTIASQGEGVDDLLDAFERHLAHMETHGDLAERRRQRLEERLRALLRDQLWREFRDGVSARVWDEVVHAMAERRLTLHDAAERLIARAPRAESGID